MQKIYVDNMKKNWLGLFISGSVYITPWIYSITNILIRDKLALKIKMHSIWIDFYEKHIMEHLSFHIALFIWKTSYISLTKRINAKLAICIHHWWSKHTHMHRQFDTCVHFIQNYFNLSKWKIKVSSLDT